MNPSLLTPAEPIRTLRPAHSALAYRTLALAFESDPVARWMFPGAGRYAHAFPSFCDLFAGRSLADGTARATVGIRGVALWLAPGAEPDPVPLLAFLERNASSDGLRHLPSLLGQMDELHPAEAHWYLPLVGVDPRRQGRGLGGTLLAEQLERCDREGLAVHLESSSPRNVPLYRRHGFEPVGEIRAGNSPALLAMTRPPRP